MGMRHGQGKFTSKDGSSYEGMWFENQMNGKGTFININGNQYTG